MRSSNLLFISSWVILLVVAGAIVLLSANSIWIAYTGAPDTLSGAYSLTQIAEQGGEEAVKAFRGRRATAATWALGYALLAITVIWIPYRRAEKWAWWAVFLSVAISQLLSMARAVMLGTTVGTGAASMVFAFVLLGLLAGAPRVFSQREPKL
ncbi:MAG TPA: hypothetical protein VFF31_23025 [Blastocatellia bacterium]|nr:hypothetical protein [Blastocatellia bacterium]